MKRAVFFGLGLALAISTSSLAAGDWSHAAGLYLWGVRANGTVTAGGDTHSIRMSGGDIIKSGNLGVGAHWEGYRVKWGFYADAVYTQANTEYTQSGVKIEPKLSLGLFDFGAAYLLLGAPPSRALRQEGPTEEMPVSLEVYFGGRYTFLEVKSDSTSDSGTTSGGGDDSFVDPLIGLRANFPVTETLLFLFRGDVGGFTLGSDLSSNFGMALHWSVAERWWLNFLYRWYTVDYRSGSGADEVVYRITHQGPVFGVTYVF